MKRSLLITAAAGLLLFGAQAAAWPSPPGAPSQAVAAAAPSAPGSSVSAARTTYDAAVTELLLAERRLSSAERSLQQAEKDVDRLQAELARAVEAAKSADQDLFLVQGRLALRLRAVYKARSSPGLELLAMSRSLTELIERSTLLARLAGQDRELALQVGRARERAAATARDLRSARDLRLRQVQALRAARDRLRAVKNEKARLAARLGNRLAAIQKEAREAERKMDDLNRRARGQPAARGAAGHPRATPSPTGRPVHAKAPAPLEPPAAPQTTAAGGRTLRVKVTAYALPGTTATGIPVGPGIIAVDPRVIPLGTRLYVPGYGEGLAADTGRAVKGNFIDVWLPTEAEAQAWGVRYLTITIYD